MNSAFGNFGSFKRGCNVLQMIKSDWTNLILARGKMIPKLTNCVHSLHFSDPPADPINCFGFKMALVLKWSNIFYDEMAPKVSLGKIAHYKQIVNWQLLVEKK